jgi:hypothetical protein
MNREGYPEMTFIELSTKPATRKLIYLVVVVVVVVACRKLRNEELRKFVLFAKYN